MPHFETNINHRDISKQVFAILLESYLEAILNTHIKTKYPGTEQGWIWENKPWKEPLQGQFVHQKSGEKIFSHHINFHLKEEVKLNRKRRNFFFFIRRKYNVNLEMGFPLKTTLQQCILRLIRKRKREVWGSSASQQDLEAKIGMFARDEEISTLVFLLSRPKK